MEALSNPYDPPTAPTVHDIDRTNWWSRLGSVGVALLALFSAGLTMVTGYLAVARWSTGGSALFWSAMFYALTTISWVRSVRSFWKGSGGGWAWLIAPVLLGLFFWVAKLMAMLVPS